MRRYAATTMILGLDSKRLEITVVDLEAGVLDVAPAGDVLVVVRAQLADFSGAVDAWIVRREWTAFLTQLVKLERTRNGEAVLESASPGELRLRVFALDRAGHMGAEAEFRVQYSDATHPQVASLKLGPIEFDPTSLPDLVRELETAAPAA
jgi:hypothetical protein